MSVLRRRYPDLTLEELAAMAKALAARAELEVFWDVHHPPKPDFGGIPAEVETEAELVLREYQCSTLQALQFVEAAFALMTANHRRFWLDNILSKVGAIGERLNRERAPKKTPDASDSPTSEETHDS